MYIVQVIHSTVYTSYTCTLNFQKNITTATKFAAQELQKMVWLRLLLQIMWLQLSSGSTKQDAH
jgi:hypothetical protein